MGRYKLSNIQYISNHRIKGKMIVESDNTALHYMLYQLLHYTYVDTYSIKQMCCYPIKQSHQYRQQWWQRWQRQCLCNNSSIYIAAVSCTQKTNKQHNIVFMVHEEGSRKRFSSVCDLLQPIHCFTKSLLNEKILIHLNIRIFSLAQVVQK